MKCKRKTDGRKLDHNTLEQLRIRTVQQFLAGEAVLAVLQGGTRPATALVIAGDDVLHP